MKSILLSLIFITTIIYPDSTFAQKKSPTPKQTEYSSESSRYGRLYDPKTMETIKGEILKIEKIRAFRRVRKGVHILVKTDKDQVWIHMGPAWYILNQNMKFKVKDKIEVTGSKITAADKPTIVAKEIIKNEKHLQLRDNRGVPYWCSWCFRE